MKDPHHILGLKPGCSEKQLKATYRKLALRYHPDRNEDPKARERFEEINEAYEFLLEHGTELTDRASSYEDLMAREMYRKDRDRRQQQVRARQAQKAREEAYFNRPEMHDPILLVKYLVHALGLLMAMAGVVTPVLVAILGDPASLAGTSFFLIAGGVLCAYIYQRRHTWFKLGKFKTKGKDLRQIFSRRSRKQSKDNCYYARGQRADGKDVRIELLKIMDIKTRNFGYLNHKVSYKRHRRIVQIPRSARATQIHRLASLIKLSAVLVSLILIPLESVAWKLLGGLVIGGILSACLHAVARVKSKVSYLFTPALLIKLVAWVLVLVSITEFGPGLSLRLSEAVYPLFVGMLLLLDMLFDLVMGFFPFYQKLFRPVIRQGKVMDRLYRDHYQNYQEFPVYSVFFPLIRWLF